MSTMGRFEAASSISARSATRRTRRMFFVGASSCKIRREGPAGTQGRILSLPMGGEPADAARDLVARPVRAFFGRAA